MLRLIIGDEMFNDDTQEFIIADPVVVDLEHSLLSLSKWESKYQRPFLSSNPNDKKNKEEIYDYIKFMLVTPNVDPDVLDRCSQENLDAINRYINSSQSATTFGTLPERQGLGEVVTSELIYFWLSNFHIPFEVERWHLNRLFALVRIANNKNAPKGKKISPSELAARNKELNDKRRAELGTRG